VGTVRDAPWTLRIGAVASGECLATASGPWPSRALTGATAGPEREQSAGVGGRVRVRSTEPATRRADCIAFCLGECSAVDAQVRVRACA